MTAWSFYPSQEGGPSNALYWLASGLSRCGFDVRVVTTDRCLPPNVVPINEWYVLNGFKVIYQSKDRGNALIYEEIKRCDILFTDGVCQLNNFIIVLKALHYNKKVVLSPRGELFEAAIDHKGRLYGFAKRCFIMVMRLFYGNKVVFHATSEEEKRAVIQYFGNKSQIACIPNYMILPNRVEGRLHNNDKQWSYLLYVGRINPIKNLDILIQGVANSTHFINGNFSLILAGETGGTYYDSLIALCEKLNLNGRVRFVGLISGEDKSVLYANAYCSFLLSKSENFGNVVIESLRQGTPVITSKGTPWRVLKQKCAGEWIDVSVHEVSLAIDAILSMNKEDYLMMRDNAYELSCSFDIFSHLQDWKDLVQGL